ncbi:rhomboid-domain-containing protein [Martensiomyces pterosporus]|nr:rhomboid-domain-containing protein [Martensiomyces pterosporus]
MVRRIAHLPGWVPFELKRTAVAFSDKWYRLSRGERCVYTIAGLNAAVFGLWQIPRLLPLMARTFLHDPRTGLSYTMLTSSFSHREVWHFLFNSIALVSFGTAVADAMGAEQFTAFYLSAGVASSLVSHVLAPLRPALILPSLGASGAVYAVVGATMMMYPNAKIALIFLPFIPVTISQAFPALMAYDLAGAVLGWQSFNHLAHLGGGLFGIAYAEWGMDAWARLTKAIEARRTAKN